MCETIDEFKQAFTYGFEELFLHHSLTCKSLYMFVNCLNLLFIELIKNSCFKS